MTQSERGVTRRQAIEGLGAAAVLGAWPPIWQPRSAGPYLDAALRAERWIARSRIAQGNAVV